MLAGGGILKCAGMVGRSEWIRTTGPCLPKTVLYQAELHSDVARNADQAAGYIPFGTVVGKKTLTVRAGAGSGAQ